MREKIGLGWFQQEAWRFICDIFIANHSKMVPIGGGIWIVIALNSELFPLNHWTNRIANLSPSPSPRVATNNGFFDQHVLITRYISIIAKLNHRWHLWVTV